VNERIDDKAFEEYLQRGSTVSQQYRALDDDGVPPALDAAVLARAAEAVAESTTPSNAVSDGKRVRAWRRWSVPVALAASTVLAVSIVLESGTRHEVTSMDAVAPIASDTPAAAAPMETSEAAASDRYHAPAVRESAPPPPPAAAAVESRASAAPPTSSERAVAEQRLQAEAARRRAMEAKAIDEERAAAKASSVQRRAEEAAGTAQAARPAPAAAPLLRQAAPQVQAKRAASMASDAAASVEMPEAWLERIRALREAGRAEDANREWFAFREAYPDFAVAADDRALPGNAR
jgi:hypothetical protein